MITIIVVVEFEVITILHHLWQKIRVLHSVCVCVWVREETIVHLSFLLFRPKEMNDLRLFIIFLITCIIYNIHKRRIHRNSCE
jgi:hypothetical protein